jgi:hypothetical protein
VAAARHSVHGRRLAGAGLAGARHERCCTGCVSDWQPVGAQHHCVAACCVVLDGICVVDAACLRLAASTLCQQVPAIATTSTTVTQ